MCEAPVGPCRGAEKGSGPICAKHPSGRAGKLDLTPFLLPFSALRLRLARPCDAYDPFTGERLWQLVSDFEHEFKARETVIWRLEEEV